MEVSSWLEERFCQPLPLPVVGNTLFLLAVLSLPHLLYAFVWLSPSVWRRTFGKKSVSIFAMAGMVGKVLQFAAVVLWAWSSQPTGICLRQSLAGWQVLLAGALVGYGQALNFGVYRAIGVTGVYYGTRLGKNVPWVSGWPFSDIDHPQYVGSAMSVWGMLALIHNMLPMPLSLYVAVFWSGLYVFSAVVEHYC